MWGNHIGLWKRRTQIIFRSACLNCHQLYIDTSSLEQSARLPTSEVDFGHSIDGKVLPQTAPHKCYLASAFRSVECLSVKAPLKFVENTRPPQPFRWSLLTDLDMSGPRPTPGTSDAIAQSLRTYLSSTKEPELLHLFTGRTCIVRLTWTPRSSAANLSLIRIGTKVDLSRLKNFDHSSSSNAPNSVMGLHPHLHFPSIKHQSCTAIWSRIRQLEP